MTTATRLAKIRDRVKSDWGVGDEHFLLGQLDDACLALNALRASEKDLLACVVEMRRELDEGTARAEHLRAVAHAGKEDIERLRMSWGEEHAYSKQMEQENAALKERNAWLTERWEAMGATLLKAQEENATLKAELALSANVLEQQNNVLREALTWAERYESLTARVAKLGLQLPEAGK